MQPRRSAMMRPRQPRGGRLCVRRRPAQGLALGLLLAAGGQAKAQIQRSPAETPIPFDYEVGRNVGVRDRDRPELEPAGYPVGGFTLLPALDLGTEISDNVYATARGAVRDVAFTAMPSVTLKSAWTRHYLRLRASGNFTRYAQESLRNQTGWTASGTGVVVVDRSLRLYADAGWARLFETRFTGATPENAASPVPFDRRFAAMRATYVGGRFRLSGAADIYDYNFRSIALFDGRRVDQDTRDRTEKRLSLQLAYRLTDSTAAFVQATWADSGYAIPLASGVPNRDSRAIRGISGLSVDLAGVMRGSIGLGYERRKYDAAIYGDISGLSVESELELFPSPITTVTVGARRLFRDSNIAGSSGFVATGGSVQVDHELFRYLLLSLGGEYEVDRYRGIDSSARVFRVGGGARYSLNRWLSLRCDISHGRRRVRGVSNGPDFAETRGLLTLTLQR
jgi:hypothetical protein